MAAWTSLRSAEKVAYSAARRARPPPRQRLAPARHEPAQLHLLALTATFSAKPPTRTRRKRPLILAALFVAGSFLGAVLDTAYRSITAGQFVHASFFGALTDAVVLFMPVYGFGFLLVALLRAALRRQPMLLRALAYGLSLALLEFAAGAALFFGLGVRLWDYSGNLGNLLGFTDALHAAYWAVLGLAADAGVEWAERKLALPAPVVLSTQKLK